MKNSILKVCVLCAFLFVNFSAFAEDGVIPADQNEYGDDMQFGVEGVSFAENLAAPINSNLYILAGAGVLVGAYFFNRNKIVKA